MREIKYGSLPNFCGSQFTKRLLKMSFSYSYLQYVLSASRVILKELSASWNKYFVNLRTFMLRYVQFG